MRNSDCINFDFRKSLSFQNRLMYEWIDWRVLSKFMKSAKKTRQQQNDAFH